MLNAKGFDVTLLNERLWKARFGGIFGTSTFGREKLTHDRDSASYHQRKVKKCAWPSSDIKAKRLHNRHHLHVPPVHISLAYVAFN